jgi:poly-beta-1,6-N-acetyl-D-glucosamine N-deacetylase
MLIRFSGTAMLFRKVFARNNVTIVMYHRPDEDIFRSHLNYFSKRYSFISMYDLLKFFYSDGQFVLPKYALLITFDDGWKENFKLIDVIAEYKIRPVVFLSSHLVNTNRNFWFTICGQEEKKRLKKMPANERLKELSIAYGYYPEKEFPENRQVLSIEEIQKMKNLADFGSHTCFHPVLSKCTAKEKSKEIHGSIDWLEEILEMPVTFFAYPDGDYDNETIEILKTSNIKIARTTDAGWNNRNSDPFRLKITGVSDNASLNKLASELTGISMFIQYLLKGSLKGVKPVA